MKRSVSLISCSLLVFASLAACNPTQPPAGGGSGGSGATATPLATNCVFPANQSSQQLTVNCTISGGLPDALIDPLDGGNTACTPFNPTNLLSNDVRDSRLVTLSSQTFSAPATVIYGTGGDDSEARVRVDINLASSTHSAQLGKTPPDCSVPTLNVPVTTTFTGTHIALIDKGRTPMCVFQSRYTPGSFSQVIGPNGPDVGGATRGPIEADIARRLDLEAARIVNGLLSSGTSLGGDFVSNSGRCAGDYHAFP